MDRVEKSDKAQSAIGCLFAAVIIIVGLVIVVGLGSQGQPNISEYRALLKEALKDPDSAQFRNEALKKQSNGNYVLCGEVNAKNSFGGYTGYKRFMAGGRIAVVEDDTNASYFSGAWIEACLK